MMKLKSLLVLAVLALGATPVLACDGAKGEAMDAARTAALKEADTNGDGVLNAQEFQAFDEAMKAQMKQLRFARLDANGDGQLTTQELESGRGHGRHRKGPQ
jgi:Ca2+-binding EF-hand superfamily protein